MHKEMKAAVCHRLSTCFWCPPPPPPFCKNTALVKTAQGADPATFGGWLRRPRPEEGAEARPCPELQEPPPKAARAEPAGGAAQPPQPMLGPEPPPPFPQGGDDR